jgi:Ohr subfamily peroxiredoxin
VSRVVYTAEAYVEGGREQGHGRTPDGALEVDLRVPRELGGAGGGANPEQLFAIGYAACFESAVSSIARRRRIETGTVGIGARVSLVAMSDDRYGLAVELDVTLPGMTDEARAADLVTEAHGVCPYSNATRGNVEVALTANGRPVTA